MPKDTSDSGDVEALAEMHAAIDELHRHNQALEDDVHNIRQWQYESNHPEEMKFLDT